MTARAKPSWSGLMPSAYPGEAVEVVGFKYEDDLYLTRKFETVKRRTGTDASYVVDKTYRASVQVKSLADGSKRKVAIEVPAGLLTDLCSVPSIARWAVSRVGPHLEASIVHDWLYVAWQHEGKGRTDTNKRFADDVFRVAMKEAKVKSY